MLLNFPFKHRQTKLREQVDTCWQSFNWIIRHNTLSPPPLPPPLKRDRWRVAWVCGFQVTNKRSVILTCVGRQKKDEEAKLEEMTQTRARLTRGSNSEQVAARTGLPLFFICSFIPLTKCSSSALLHICLSQPNQQIHEYLTVDKKSTYKSWRPEGISMLQTKCSSQLSLLLWVAISITFWNQQSKRQPHFSKLLARFELAKRMLDLKFSVWLFRPLLVCITAECKCNLTNAFKDQKSAIIHICAKHCIAFIALMTGCTFLL